MKVIIVIPARGASVGIPRKALRILNGRPLIYYVIDLTKNINFDVDVIVSSEDDEIIAVANNYGVYTKKRDPGLSEPEVPLDPVIYDAVDCMEKAKKIKYDLVVTLQPTSPLLKPESLEDAIQKFRKNENLSTIISAKEDRHLGWVRSGNTYIRQYEKRLNRQYLPQYYRETGAFLISRRDYVSSDNRIGPNLDLVTLSMSESIDIDDYQDINLCEYYLRRKKILFIVCGSESKGMGHVYRVLAISSRIIQHSISFLVSDEDELAYHKIALSKYPITILPKEKWEDYINSQKPDVIINDILDTDGVYMKNLKKTSSKVINFEDLGNGRHEADLVINDLYLNDSPLKNECYGPGYFCAREEFISAPNYLIRDQVKNILISFGGTDPGRCTEHIIESIHSIVVSKGLQVTVVVGMGCARDFSHLDGKYYKVIKDAHNMAELMLSSDVAFSSAGRTIYELAVIGVPTIVICQNEREGRHLFANKNNGFVNLGHVSNVNKSAIVDAFQKILPKPERVWLHRSMKKTDLRGGADRVIRLIFEQLEGL